MVANRLNRACAHKSYASIGKDRERVVAFSRNTGLDALYRRTGWNRETETGCDKVVRHRRRTGGEILGVCVLAYHGDLTGVGPCNGSNARDACTGRRRKRGRKRRRWRLIHVGELPRSIVKRLKVDAVDRCGGSSSGRVHLDSTEPLGSAYGWTVDPYFAEVE